MEFIAKNYFLIIIIAAFLLFALIGYMVDTEKKRKKVKTMSQVVAKKMSKKKWRKKVQKMRILYQK